MVAAMPASLGELCFKLRTEVIWLHLKWKDFQALFACSAETVKLLNAAAPVFFGESERRMWEDVLLHLCRLTDPPKSSGYEHLTLRRLPDSIPDANLQNQVRSLVDAAYQKTQFARYWRNDALAHKNFLAANQKAKAPLQGSCQDVEDALAAIRRTMNCIEQHYLGSSESYRYSSGAPGGVESLLAHLRKGVDAMRIEREKRLGQYHD